MDKTFKFIALGCKVNTYENSATEEIFRTHGYTLNEKDPEVIVINTCSVTSTADQKSRQIIRRERRNFPNAIIVTMGCYSQHASEIIKGFNADIILGVKYRNKIFDLVEEFKKNHAQIVLISDDTRHLEYESFTSFAVPESTRAYIKIEDGCNNFCTYCLIPYIRGNARSRPKDEIINEIKHLMSLGYKEFVLTGIHTAHYGVDIKGLTFSDLVEEILDIPNLYRLRISSIEESEIDDKLIELIRTRKNLASHLHMPLQSGCKDTLKRMGRKYNVDDFLTKVNRIREANPDIAITTDVIVGFPGEKEEHFNETYEFIKKVNFAELHVFPFSAREGTKAYTMKDQVDPKIKTERVNKLLELSKVLEKNYRDKFIGKEMEIIIEERNKVSGLLSGYTSNYLKVNVDLPDSYIGQVVKIKI